VQAQDRPVVVQVVALADLAPVVEVPVEADLAAADQVEVVPVVPVVGLTDLVGLDRVAETRSN
jgi:hypothetical protein